MEPWWKIRATSSFSKMACLATIALVMLESKAVAWAALVFCLIWLVFWRI